MRENVKFPICFTHPVHQGPSSVGMVILRVTLNVFLWLEIKANLPTEMKYKQDGIIPPPQDQTEATWNILVQHLLTSRRKDSNLLVSNRQIRFDWMRVAQKYKAQPLHNIKFQKDTFSQGSNNLFFCLLLGLTTDIMSTSKLSQKSM